jgi:hypothetical protein
VCCIGVVVLLYIDIFVNVVAVWGSKAWIQTNRHIFKQKPNGRKPRQICLVARCVVGTQALLAQMFANPNLWHHISRNSQNPPAQPGTFTTMPCDWVYGDASS